MFLIDWIKEMIWIFKYDEILQYGRLMKHDAKMAKKNGGGLYWGDDLMTIKIMKCMMKQNDEPKDIALEVGSWLAMRFRYTNEEVVKLMKDFYHDEYHFDYILYGMRIFDVMKEKCMSYPEAILTIYEIGTNFKETKMLSGYYRRPGHGLKMQYAYDFDLDNRIKYDFNRYNDVLPNLTIEQHEELMEAVRTSSIEIAKEMGIITSDDEFDGLNLDEYKELKSRLVKNEKQILIDKGFWNDRYNYDYLTDEELAEIDKRIEEDLKKTAEKWGLKYEQ